LELAISPASSRVRGTPLRSESLLLLFVLRQHFIHGLNVLQIARRRAHHRYGNQCLLKMRIVLFIGIAILFSLYIRMPTWRYGVLALIAPLFCCLFVGIFRSILTKIDSAGYFLRIFGYSISFASIALLWLFSDGFKQVLPIVAIVLGPLAGGAVAALFMWKKRKP
jgi:hypothetical protein